MRMCQAHIEAPAKASCSARAAVLLALALVLLPCAPGGAFATYADYDEDNAAAQEIGAYGDAMYAADIPDGVYEVDARTSSSMCIMYRTYEDASNKVSKEKCYVQVKDGKMTARFYLSNMYTRLYLGGTAKDAASLTNDDGSDDSPYIAGDPAEGYVPHYYAVEIPALNYLIKFASFAGGNYSYSSDPNSTWYKRAKWYSRAVVFMPNKNTLAAIEAAENAGSESQTDDGSAGSESGSSSGSEASSGGGNGAGNASDGGSSAPSDGGSSGGETQNPASTSSSNGGEAESGASGEGDGSSGGDSDSGSGGTLDDDAQDGGSSDDDGDGGQDGSQDSGSGDEDEESDDDGSGGGSQGAAGAYPSDDGAQGGQGGLGADQPASEGPEGDGGEAGGAQAASSGSGGSVRGVAIRPAALALADSDDGQSEQVDSIDAAPDSALSPQQAVALLFAGLAAGGLAVQAVSFAIARRARSPRGWMLAAPPSD